MTSNNKASISNQRPQQFKSAANLDDNGPQLIITTPIAKQPDQSSVALQPNLSVVKSEGRLSSAWQDKINLPEVPEQVKLASRLTGAYLCESRSYFSKTKYVLQLKRDPAGSSEQSTTPPMMLLILQATRNDSDRRIWPLHQVTKIAPNDGEEDEEQFTITFKSGAREELFSTERDRLLTEIAIEMEIIEAQEMSAWSHLADRDFDEDAQVMQQTGAMPNEVDPKFQVEHRRDFFFQDQETVRQTTTLTLRPFGICIQHEQNSKAQQATAAAQQQESNFAGLNLNNIAALKQTTNRRPAARANAIEATVAPREYWIFYCDIDFIYQPRAQAEQRNQGDQQSGNSIMYIVKKNKEVEKFVVNSPDIYKSIKNKALGCLHSHYSKVIRLVYDFNTKDFTEDKHFSIHDLALCKEIFKNELRGVVQDNMIAADKCIGDGYRMLFELPNHHQKDKEVILKLFSNRITISQRLKQRALGNEAVEKSDFVIFTGRIDSLQKFALYNTGGVSDGNEPGLGLCLTFFCEENDTYRDIYLKKPKDGKDLAHHKKKMSELIATILVLREEIINDHKVLLNSKMQHVSEDHKQSLRQSLSEQMGRVMLNNLMILPLPEKPQLSRVTMGCQPRRVTFEEFESKNLREFTVDPDYEQNTFQRLIKLWKDLDASHALELSQKHQKQEGISQANLAKRQQTLEAEHKKRLENENRLQYLLHDICENCSYFNLKPSNERDMHDFVEKLNQLIDDYERLEARQIRLISYPGGGGGAEHASDYHESELDTASEDEHDRSAQQIETIAHETLQTLADEAVDLDGRNEIDTVDLDASSSFRNDSMSGIVKGGKTDAQKQDEKKFNYVTSNLARMLLIFQRVMQSSHVYSDHFQISSNTQNSSGSQISISSYQILTRRLFKLLKVENYLMTYLASQCLVSIIQFVDGTERESESRNKSSILMSRPIDMMKYVARHLSFHDRYFEMNNKIYCHLSMKMIADLLRALFCGRQAPQFNLDYSRLLLSDASKHDYDNTLRAYQKSRGEKIIHYASASSQSSMSHDDRRRFIVKLRADDFKLLHIVERFSMMQQHLVASVSYGRIVSDLLEYCSMVRNDTTGQQISLRDGSISSNFILLQYRLFAYSVNMLVQLDTLMKGIPSATEQEDLKLDRNGSGKDYASGSGPVILRSSITNALSIFTHLIHENKKARKVIEKKIFKKFLLNQVQTYKTKIKDWGQAEWYNFFVIARMERSQGPSSFWDDKMRQDCRKAIRKEFKDFKNEIQAHIKPILLQSNDLTHLTHQFTPTGQLETKSQHLKWNFEEFEVTYAYEKSKTKIWKYYLKELVQENEIEGTIVPKLHDDFNEKDSKKLWDHLIEVFVPENTQSDNLADRLLILKCLILLYRNFSDKIGKMKLLPYWLRLLQDPGEKRCHFLVLQLILVILSVPKTHKEASEIANANVKIFEDSNGLQIVLGCLSFGYRDMKESKAFNQYREDGGAAIDEEFSVKDSPDKAFPTLALDDKMIYEESEANSEPFFHEQTAEFNLNSQMQQTRDFNDFSGVQAGVGAGSKFMFNQNNESNLEDLVGRVDDQSIQEQSEIKMASSLNNVTQYDAEVQKQNVNFTIIIKNKKIFETNSEYINLAILAFTILDFCMSQKKNRGDDYPLSRSKGFLLQRNNVAIVVQLLLMPNNDLLRCILKFIYSHFKSEYALETIKDSGIVEFLILLLDNKEKSSIGKAGVGDSDSEEGGAEVQQNSNKDQDRARPEQAATFTFKDKKLPPTIADCAFELLKRLSSVWTEDSNADIDDYNFDSNDLKLLEQMPELKKSPFLRYFPIPLIIASENPNEIGRIDDNTTSSDRDFFLKIYQRERHEQATIIWKDKMRDQLKREIQRNNAKLFQELEEYFNYQRRNGGPESPLEAIAEGIPIYMGRLPHRISYTNIEKEVKCGKYYLRIWVKNNVERKENSSNMNNKDEGEIKIPVKEEGNYLENLKGSFSLLSGELDKIVSNDEAKSERVIRDLTYTLKACLYASETFKDKNFVVKDQVVNLIEKIMDKYQARYSFRMKTELQQILMLAFKIVNVMITPPDNKQRKQQSMDTAKQFSRNREQLLKSENIIRLHENVIGLIYDKAQKKERNQSTQNRLNKPEEAQLKYFEAQILCHAVQNLDILVRGRNKQSLHDYQKSLDPMKKFQLCINFTRILGLAEDLFQVVDRNQTNDEAQRKNSGQYLNQPKAATIENSIASTRSTSTYGKTNIHVHGLASQKEAKKSQQQNHQRKGSVPLKTTRAKTDKKPFTFDLSEDIKKVTKDDSHQRNNPLMNSQRSARGGNQKAEGNLELRNFDLLFAPNDIELAFKRNRKQFEGQLQEMQLSQRRAEDKFRSAIELSTAIFKFGVLLSREAGFVPQLIQSGFLWRVLQFVQFSMQREMLNTYKSIDSVIDNCCLILLEISSKAAEKIEDREIKEKENEQIQIPSERETEDEESKARTEQEDADQIWIDFSNAFARLLPKKIFETLQVPRMRLGEQRMTLGDNDQKEQKQNAGKFRKLFSLEHEVTPELVWESSMREELRDVLSSQLDSILVHYKITKDFKNDYNIFKHQIEEFLFNVDKKELKINEIFVKHFNDDIFFRPPNMEQFIKALVIRLQKDTDQGVFSSEMTDENIDNVYEITKALHNLVKFQNALNTTDFQVDQNITLFCTMLRSELFQNNEKIVQVKEVLIEMLSLISQDREFATNLLTNLQFVCLVAQTFNTKEHRLTEIQTKLTFSLTQILREIWDYKNRVNESEFVKEFTKFLTRDGMVVFFLRLILNKSQNVDSRRMATYILQQNILNKGETYKKVGAWFPAQFLFMREKPVPLMNQDDDDIKRARLFIQHVDMDNFENQFVIWSEKMLNGNAGQPGINQAILEKCDELQTQLEALTKLTYQQNEQWQANNFNLEDSPTPALSELTRITMEHELVIEGIILRIFNQNPNVYTMHDFASFMEALLSTLQTFVATLEILKSSIASLAADPSEPITLVPDQEQPIQSLDRLRKLRDYISQRATLVCTSLLLAFEQVTCNELNPNFGQRISEMRVKLNQQVGNAELRRKTSISSRTSMRASASHSQVHSLLQQSQTSTIQSAHDDIILEEKLKITPRYQLLTFVTVEIQKLTLVDRELPFELRATFLQLVNRVFEFNRNTMASDPKILTFIQHMLTQIEADMSPEETLEAKIVLDLLGNVVSWHGGTAMVTKLIPSPTQSPELQKLRQICFQFGCLDRIATHVMNQMSQKSAEIQAFFRQEASEASSQSQEETEKWQRILDENQTNNLLEGESGVSWRRDPTNTQQPLECLEGKLEQQSNNGNGNQQLLLPCISRDYAVGKEMLGRLLESNERDLPIAEKLLLSQQLAAK